MSERTTCPACGLVLPGSDGALDPGQLLASPECLGVYAEVTGAVLASPAVLARWHQTTVDAYTAQHAGPATRPLSVWFALNTLYLVLERGWTGTQGREAHGHLARTLPPGTWTPLPLPGPRGDVDVLDVALAGGGQELAEAIASWGRAVWGAWSHVHDEVRAATDRQLEGWRPRG
jgi:hypothetical protein